MKGQIIYRNTFNLPGEHLHSSNVFEEQKSANNSDIAMVIQYWPALQPL